MNRETISRRVSALSPSATLAMSSKSAELRASGVDIINMAVGEPDFDTPHHIKEAAKRAIDDNFSHYSPVQGYLSLRRAICDNLLSANGLEFTPEQIVVGNGAKQELSNAVLTLVNPGDEVIIPTPAWVSYVEMVKLAGGVPVELYAPMEQGFKITPAQLEEAITERTVLLMLNTPSNPTGAIYSRTELAALAAVLERHPQVFVLSDEIYGHINFGGRVHSLCEFAEVRDRVVLVNGVSKAYAMTGWRIGYLAAAQPVADAVAKLQSQTTSGASSIAQKAAEAAYLGPQTCVSEMCGVFRRRRDLIVSLATGVEGWRVSEPQGAFYLFPDVSALLGRLFGDRVIRSSEDYALFLLEEARVATVAGEAFRAPGHIRLSFATSDRNIREAMRRIADATLRLR